MGKNKIKKQYSNKKFRLDKFIYYFVLISFIVPIVFLIIKLAFGGDTASPGGRSKADYVLMLIQCILGVIVIHVPSILSRKWNIKLPKILFVMYILFLYGAIFLGEVRSFYYHVPHWDDILHCMSSIMTGSFGFMVIYILNDDKKVAMNMSPKFAALFAFTFSLTIGALWEIYEYTFDGLLGLNMQKHTLENGVVLMGHDAITDTIKDIVVDSVGAFLASCVGYFSMKTNKGWVHDYMKNGNEKANADSDETEKTAECENNSDS